MSVFSRPCTGRGLSTPARLAAGLWLAALVLLAAPAAVWAGELTVEVLDVGQGDAVLVRTADKVVLIDAGVQKDDVVTQLEARGLTRLDMVVATHPHADHIGGMQRVVERFEIGIYIDSGQVHTSGTYDRLMNAVEERGVRYRTARNGQVYKLGEEARFEVLFPVESMLSGTRSDLNSNSVVLRLVHGENCFLFTGDAEEPTEQALVQAGLGQCDVLKVAHHGGNHSSSASFLDAVSPKLALISCGAGNSYGHPGKETLERLESRGIKVHRTDTEGLLRLVSDGKKVSVTTGNAALALALPAKAVVSPQVEEPSDDTRPEPSETGSAAAADAIDINTAGAAELESLPGIGPSKAAAIVADRDANGPFSSCMELTRVKGIGDATARKLLSRCRTE